MEAIETAIYIPHPDRPGFLKCEGARGVRDVIEELNQRLYLVLADDTGEEFRGENGFSAWPIYPREDNPPWPEARWIACFAVEGGSEAHWVHIEATALVMEGRGQTDQRQLMGTFKTFGGLERALEIAAISARCFYD